MHPSRPAPNAYGHSLIADADLDPGAIVARFEGPIVPFRDVPEGEICHVLLIEGDQWIVPSSTARYINHSCEPNCVVLDSLKVATIRPVRRGEELTIRYNGVGMDEYLRDPTALFWDPRWTFRCRCGSSDCAGMIDGYLILRDEGRAVSPAGSAAKPEEEAAQVPA